MSNLGVLDFLGRYFYRYRPLFVSYAPLQEPGRKGRNTMKIKMRYENAYQTIEVETTELEEWLNISISEDESEEDYEKRIQEEIEVQFNRPDYNKESIERENQWEYESVCKKIREVLKPDIADMVIAIVLDGQTVGEYAASIKDSANNVSHRYRRALNTLKKVFSKTSF